MEYHIAPVQGHTDAAYRHFHSIFYPGQQFYYSPFIRLEKEEIRPRDLKDIKAELNNNVTIIPQIIFKDGHELSRLIEILEINGFKRIDLNMGCPFPLQTGHGRGAATINNSSLYKELYKAVTDNPEISFSVKMRLGLESPNEWESLIPLLNELNLTHIAVHPRVAKQQYGGEVNLLEFDKILQKSKNPVIYNGDLKLVEDIDKIVSQFPAIKGIMVGRGVLGRPSLILEHIQKKEIEKSERINKMLEFHNALLAHYNSILCGNSQIISKIQPFWEYAEDEIGRKAWKSIKKASNISKYQTAVAMIQNNLL